MSPGLSKGVGVGRAQLCPLSSGLDRVGAAWLCSEWPGVDDVDGMKLPPGHPMALSAACPVSLISNTAMHVAWPLVVTLVTLGEPHPHH